MSEGNGTRPPFEGETITLAGREYVLPALSTKQARKHWEKVRTFDVKATPELIPTRYEHGVFLIHQALARNYPELTLEQVDDWVDLRNFTPLVLKVMALSGMPVTQGPEPAGGGIEAVASTGGTSTAPLSPEPGGPGNTSIN